jgi:hypothetical protein
LVQITVKLSQRMLTEVLSDEIFEATKLRPEYAHARGAVALTHLSFEQHKAPVVRANNTGAHKHDRLNKEGYIHDR